MAPCSRWGIACRYPTFSTGNLTSEAHLPSHHSAPHPSLSPHLWFPLPSLLKPLLMALGAGQRWLERRGAPRCGPLFVVAPGPGPGFVTRPWRLQNEEEQGRPIKEG